MIPKEITVLETEAYKWTRQDTDTQTEFRRYHGPYLSAQVIVEPDAELVPIDGHEWFFWGRWAQNLYGQRFWADSRLQFDSGLVVYEGFWRKTYARIESTGLLKTLGSPPWLAPHNLEWTIVNDVGLTHVFTTRHQVEPFLLDPETGFYQLDALRNQPGEARLIEKAGKAVLVKDAKEYPLG